MNIKAGNRVKPSRLCMSRDWWENVRHLKDKKMKVVEVDGPYIKFCAESGKVRRWHHSNLTLVGKIQLENK